MLSPQELAVLLATRASENCQSLIQLSQEVEAPVSLVAGTIDSLVGKKILEEVDSYDGIRYGYPPGDEAQEMYARIYGPL